MGKTDSVARIITITEALERFWRQAHGWAPASAADLLASARLDRQVSFTYTLSDHLKPFPQQEAEARQILGYATLRSLCEGVLKLFFSIWLEDYIQDCDALKDKKNAIVSPEDISFDRLIALYSKKGDSAHEAFLRRVQQRGNAIHHFTDRKIGSQDELIADIGEFLQFLIAVDGRLPYPDDDYRSTRA